MNRSLEKRCALVTGGSRGIGAAIVKRLANEGANVAFTYLNHPEHANEVMQEVRSLGVRCVGIKADSTSSSAVIAAVEQTVKEFGGLDILVNSAGIAKIAPFDDFSLEDFDQTIAVNLRAIFIASQAAAKYMKNGGRIVMIGSCNADRMPFAGGAIYAMSKAGLIGLVKGMARDLAPRGITVNNIQPGPTETDMNPSDSEFADILRKQFLALPRYAEPDEIAGMVSYLVSPEAGYVTGASLTIDGGFSA